MANAVITKDQTPALDFADISGALEYWAQICTDQRFSVLESEACGLATSTYTPGANLTDAKKYYWRFRARTSATLSTDQSNTTGAGTGTALRDAAARTALAQTFKAGKSLPISRVILSMKKVVAPTGNIWAEIWSTSGGAPSAQLGADSGVVDVSTLGAGYGNVNFDFATSIPVIEGTTYALLIFGDNAIDGTNYPVWEDDGAGSYANGSSFKNSGAAWSADGTYDHIFTTQTHSWGIWSPVWSFWLDTSFNAAVTPTGWTFVDPADTNDTYTWAVIPKYLISPRRIRRGVSRNILGDLLSEYVATRDYIELDFERAQPKWDQVAEFERWSEKRKAIFLIALTDYEQDVRERIWKVEFVEDLQFVPLAEGRQDYYRGAVAFEEASLT